jgi:hypothetical protein
MSERAHHRSPGIWKEGDLLSKNIRNLGDIVCMNPLLTMFRDKKDISYTVTVMSASFLNSNSAEDWNVAEIQVIELNFTRHTNVCWNLIVHKDKMIIIWVKGNSF